MTAVEHIAAIIRTERNKQFWYEINNGRIIRHCTTGIPVTMARLPKERARR